MATLQERLNAAKKDTRGANLGVRQYSGSLQDRLNAAKMDTGASFTGVTARDAASAFRQAAAREQPEPLLSGLGGKGAAQLAQGALFTPEQRTQAAENRLKELDGIEADLKAFEMATQYAPANQRPVKDIGGFTSSQAAREEYDRVMAEYAALLKENGKTDGNFGRNVRYALEKGGAGLGAALEGLGDAGAAALLDGRVGKALSGISPAVNIVQQVDKLTGDRVGELADKMLKSNPSAQRMRDIESRYAPSRAGQVAGEVAQGIGGMLPSIAANIALPGSGMAVLGVQAGGQSAQQALNEGAALEQAVNYGVLSGAMEAATEMLSGGLGGLGEGFIDKGIGKLVAKNGTQKVGGLLSKVISNSLVKAVGDSLGEGLEEAVSAVVDPLLQRVTYNKEAESATLGEVLHDAFIGVLTGGVFQGVGAVANLAAGQKNPASGVVAESTAVNTNPAEHTPQEQAVIDAYQAEENAELKALFEEHHANPRRGFSRRDISAVSERQAADAARLLGGNYTGYKNAINSNGVKHILKEHGPDGTVDRSLADLNDAARMGYVLDNYDGVEVVAYESGEPDLSSEFRTKENAPAPMLKFSKKVNGTYYVVEAIPESKYKKFWVVSAYMQTADGGTQALDANGPGNTPNASLASSLSAADSTVPQPEAEVNGITPEQARFREWVFAEGRRQAAKRAAAAQGGGQESVLGTGKVTAAPEQTAPQRATQGQTEGKAVRPGVVDARTRADAAPLEQTLKKRDVLYLEAASKATDVPINIVDATEGADGWYENGQIYLSENCEDPVNWVATHEITHHLEQAAPEAYNEYLECVQSILQEEGGLEEKVQKIRQHYAEQGTELTEDGAMRELAANFTERLRLDENLFRRVAEENRSVAQRLLDSLKEFIRKLRTAWSGPEIRALENARKAWETALRESRGKTVEQGERRYSIKRTSQMTLAQQLKAYYDGKMLSSDAFYFGETPDPLKAAGLDKLPLVFTSSDFKKSTKKKHNVPRRVLNGLNKNLEEALFAFFDGDRYGILTADIDGDGKPLLVAIQKNVQMDVTKVNAIRSVYGLDHPAEWIRNQIDEGKTFVVLDEQKANTTLYPYGYKASRKDGIRPLDEKIAQENGTVKKEGGEKQNSIRGTRELEKQAADLRKQNERLQAQNDRLKGQMKRSGAARTDEAEVKRTAGGLLKDFGSRYGREQLAGRLQKLYDSMANPSGPNSMTESEMRREAQSIAKDILSEVSVLNDDMYREYSDLRNYLRTTKIMVPQELWGDLDSEGGYNEFRKRNMGRLSLSSTEGRSIDDVYQELSYDYPGLFDQDAVSHPADQLVQMAEIAGNLRPTYENPYAADRAAIDWLAGEIMERFYDLPQQKGTFADRAAARVDEVRRQERRAAQERLQKHLQEQEKRHEKRIANIKESNRQAGKRMRENMSATKLRDTIKRHAEGLSRKLLRPTDRQRIPARLQGSALALLEVIDLESKYAYEFTRDATFKRVNRDETIGEGEPTSRTSAARALKAAYEELRSDPEFNGTVDPDLADKLEEIAKMGDVRLADMGREQLQTVWEAVRAVEASVTKSDKMLGASKYGKISTAAEKIRAEMGDRKDRKNLVGALGKADRLLNLDMLSPETFLHRMGAVGEDIHRQMRRAQDKNVEILKEGVEFYRKAAEETKVDLLKAEKEMHTFKLPGGTIELTTAQVMDLYALSKRRAAMEHIYKGGLRTQGGRKGLVETGKSKAVKVTMMDVADILEVLTPEQKRLVDKLQEYMSTRLAAHGNEASMEAYDYEKFKEKVYWPIKVSKTETDTDPASEARAKTIPGFGMTKALQPHANNSVMLRSALDSFGEHLNQMATYAAWLTTSENITKLVNYDFVEGNARTGTVKDLLLKIYGKGGEQYLTKLLSDVAQGTKTGSGEGAFTDSMFGRWKGAKVGANIRVILQQPTAILRAAEMIDAKYMAQTGNPFKGWQKALEWSPIAQWKDWGYFEMDAGRSMRELMAGTRNVLDKTRNAAMAPAGKMDNMAWGMLWNAVEAETKAKHRELKVGSDEYYRAVAERFGDVIDRTQVVDSVLHRTQIMRSSNALNRMATSFMSEPSKIYNMVARDIYDIKNSERGSEANKRAWKHVARTSVALTASFAVNAVAQSIADALRDDDRDKEYLEKFGDAYMENFWQNFDPLGYLPYVKDVESIIQGFTVDRSDMEGLADLAQAAKTLVKAVNGSGNKTVLNAGMETLNKALDAFGLPASNIKRDVMGVLSTVLQATGAHELTYKVDKVMLDIRKNGNAGVYYDTLYRAMNDDYDAYVKIYDDMVKNGMDPEKILSGMEKRMAKELGLSGTLMLPVDYYAPGKSTRFDQLLKSGQATGGTWADSVDADLVALARELESIKNESGANDRRMRAIADSEYSESVKEASMKRVMGTAAYNRYLVARDAKISTYDYVNLLDDIKAATLKRRGESGNASQDDVVEALRQSGLTGAQKRAVWYSYGYKSESPWG